MKISPLLEFLKYSFTLHSSVRKHITRVTRILFISIFLITTFIETRAQNLKRIAKAIDKSEFGKAKELINKNLIKDPNSFGIYYFSAIYYLDSSLTQYNLDSARLSINQSLRFKKESSEEQKEDWEKTELSLKKIDSVKIQIIDLIFDREYNRLSAESMKYFLTLFPDSHLNKKVVFLRDSMAYEDTKNIDTWQAYKKYLEEYTEAKFKIDARANYELLLFKEKTKSQDLNGYVTFLEEYPDTPYRRACETAIFSKKTKTHNPDAYINFINEYPDSFLNSKAADILYYQFKAGRKVSFSDLLIIHPRPDSLRKINKLEKLNLIPTSHEGRFTFMNKDGNIIPDLEYEQLSEDYNCGQVYSEWLHVKSESNWIAINRNGDPLAEEISKLKEVGTELIIAETKDGPRLFHKSGFQIVSFDVEEANVIFDKWIAFSSESHWGIMTFTGQVLIQPMSDMILQEGTFLIVSNNENHQLINEGQLKTNFGQEKLNGLFSYSDYEILNDSLIIGFEGDNECLLNDELTQLTPLSNHVTYLNKNIIYVKGIDGYKIFDQKDRKLQETQFEDLKINDSWLALKDSVMWTLTSTCKLQNNINLRVDSVNFINAKFSYIQKNDSAFILFDSAKLHFLEEKSAFRLLSDGNSMSDKTGFILKTNNSKKSILDENGEIVFEGTANDIKYLNDSLIILVVKGKYGIYQLKKGFIQKCIYDGLTIDDGLVLMLKSNLIGCYDLKNNNIIQPIYHSRIKRFGKQYLVTKSEKIGVIDKYENQIIPFEFDELKAWNDTSFLARTDYDWALRTYDGEVLLQEIQSISKWYNYIDESYYQIESNGKLGIIHPEKGIMIPARYNEIINIGSSTKPIFFAEEHLEAADFYVVTYFDSQGSTIKSQAYRPSEYKLIYCNQQ